MAAKSGWFESFSRALAGERAPDPEEERTKKRNEARVFGKGLEDRRAELAIEWEKENRIYIEMMRRSMGKQTSPFAKHALDAKRNRSKVAIQMQDIDTRLSPIKEMLTAVQTRQMDKEFNQVMGGMVAVEQSIPAEASRKQTRELLKGAKEIVSDTAKLSQDMSDLGTGAVVENIADSESDFAADYAQLTSQAAAGAQTSNAASAETDEAAAIVALMRHGAPQTEVSSSSSSSWTPPSGFMYPGQH